EGYSVQGYSAPQSIELWRWRLASGFLIVNCNNAVEKRRRDAGATRSVFLVRNKFSARLRDSLDQRWFPALHHLHGALDRRAEVFRIRDRAFGIDAHALCDHGEIDIGIGERGPDGSAIDASAVPVSHALHVH